jgi:hypothetical protein
MHRELIEAQVKEWLKVGVIQKSNSKYNCPIFLVPKKDSGAFRIVQDFRKLNANTMEDKYSMRDVTECIAEIGRAESSIFSTLDLTSGFWQLPLDEKSRQYTAFNLYGFGQFEWLVASMGLSSSPSAFQRLMELTLDGIKNAIVYIDDVLVHTKTHSHHREILQSIFDRFRKANLKLNLKKCEFGSDTVTYLGFRLTPKGILPGKDKLAAVQKATPPSEVKHIKQFLGLCNFFRSHIRNFASISNPLNKLTRKDSKWKGGPLPKEALQAFNELKVALCSEPVVDFPRKNRPYALIVDASTGNAEKDGGLSAILAQQNEKNEFHVIAYASRGLVKHEKNYTPFLAEMMAAVWGMDHFDNYLKGRHFTLYTDHKPLESLGKVHTKTLNRLQQAMNEYSFSIVYMKGADMPADFLSRNVLAEIDVFTPDLPQLQEQDEFVGAIRTFIKENKLPQDPIKAFLVKKVSKECFFENNILWRRLDRFDAPTRTVLMVPKALAGALVQEAHGQLLTGHNGIAKTKERLLSSYYWPNMDATIAEHIKGCRTCQSRRKDDRPQPHILSPLPQCSAPNQRVHLDLFGSLKTSESGKQFVLCMTDAFTKYVELVAIPNKEAATVGLQFFNKWICRYGTPLEITTDQGKEFVNKLNKELCQLLQVKHSTTTPAHPQTNATCEVVNKTIAKYLASFTDSSTLDWEKYLAPLAFSYNTSLHNSIKATPYFVTYGQEPRLPSFPAPDIQRQLQPSHPQQWFDRLTHARHLAAHHNFQATDRYAAAFNKSAHPCNYQVGQLLWLDVRNFLGKNKKLAQNWEGPYPILKIHPFGVVDIQLKNRVFRCNVSRTKPYYPPANVQHRPELDEQQQHQQQHTSSQPASSQHNSRRSPVTPVYRQLQQTRPNVPTQPTNASFPQQQHNFPGASPPPQNTARGRTRPNVQQMLQQPLRQVPTQLQHNFPLPTDFDTGGGNDSQNFPHANASQAFAPQAVNPNDALAAAAAFQQGQHRQQPQQQQQRIIVPHFSLQASSTNPPPRENFPQGEGMLTRAKARAQLRQSMPATEAMHLCQYVNNIASQLATALKQNKKWVTKLGFVPEGPQFKADEFGLPQQQHQRQQPDWVIKRRAFLQKLSVSQRNLLLTGDPSFAFDPVAYEVLFTVPHQQLPPVLQQQFEYLDNNNQPPEEDDFLSAESNGEESPAAQPRPVFQQFGTRPRHAPTASSSSSANEEDSDATNQAAAARQPTKREKERVNQSAQLLQRLTTEELKGGKLTRSVSKPTAPVSWGQSRSNPWASRPGAGPSWIPQPAFLGTGPPKTEEQTKKTTAPAPTEEEHQRKKSKPKLPSFVFGPGPSHRSSQSKK